MREVRSRAFSPSVDGAPYPGVMAAGRSTDVSITGEAVVVSLPYAGLAMRVFSGLIDVVVEILLAVGFGWLLSRVANGLDEALLASFSLLIGVFCLVVFPSVCESLTGRTVGKKLTGLRTVRSDGAPADPRRVVTRHLIGVVEIWVSSGAIALITGMMTEPTRRLGDIAAGTYVARDRVNLELPPPPAMPPGLAAWARSADMARLPDDLAALIRATLAQAGDFTGASAHRIDEMLVARARPYVSPPPPQGTPPRAYLHAVMAERRRRETARLTAAEDRRRRLFTTAR